MATESTESSSPQVATLNPYAAPVAETRAEPDTRAHRAAKQQIKAAVAAGLIVTLVTGAVAVASLIMQAPVMGIDHWALLDAAVFGGLSLGVFFKSRVCAVLLVLVFLGNKLYGIIVTGHASGIVMAVLLGYYMLKGVRGTIAWHRLQR